MSPTAGQNSSPFRVYSPSETGDWLTCPVWRQFRKPSVLPELGEVEPHTWEPREVEWDPARLLGIAVQKGVNVWLQGQKAKQPTSADGVCDVVDAALTRGFQEGPKWTLLGLRKLALRGVEAVLEKDLFGRHAILMVDEPLSQSRPDVVSRHETEGLGVTDFKVSQQVSERYRAQRLSSYETDDQFWHYAWEVGETLGEPVKWFRPVVVILTPKAQVLTDTIRVTPERLAFWLAGAEQHWRDMTGEDRGERPVVPRWPACQSGRFGVCKAYDFCHHFERDPRQATVYYERRAR